MHRKCRHDRSEYRGTLAHVPGAQTISLAPLTDSDTTVLLDELLGPDPSVAAARSLIADRAAGNPFFAQEIVRELAERGVLHGNRGAYGCRTGVAEVTVPATLQAAIAARIDRLDGKAKRTLSAAAVIGSRFGVDLLTVLGIEPTLNELVKAELIDQVRFTPRAEYSFRHPLIRTVAYESQLKSDRAQLHRRLAAAIESRDPVSVDENTALIAEHLEAAGDLHGAYAWHMRAGAWSTNRDIAAARTSWRRACQVADRLPEDAPHRMSMRIAPRTLLTASAWRLGGSGADTGFDELRELCTAAGDKRSLAIGMAGLVMDHYLNARCREASRLASEHTALLESIGDSSLTVGLSFAALAAKLQTSEMTEVLRLAQCVIDLADGDPSKGNLILGSPLVVALAIRGNARWARGILGWRDDYDQAVAIARGVDATMLAGVMFYKYVVAIPSGVLMPDATALRETAEALAIAERSGDDLALELSRSARAIALMHQDGPEHDAGVALLEKVREDIHRERFSHAMSGVIDIHVAKEKARSGDLDGAIELSGTIVDDRVDSGEVGWTVLATVVLVEALLRRRADGDLQQAQAAIDRLADVPTEPGMVMFELWPLRLRALVARAQGDEAEYRELADRYRAMATSLGYEGHMKWAEAMP